MRAPRPLRVVALTAAAGFATVACDVGRVDAVDGGKTITCDPPKRPSPYPGCNPEIGIECDGDFRATDPITSATLCDPECPADQCCSPQAGRFTCVGREDSGRCPAADLFIDAERVASSYALEYRTFSENDCAIVEGCVGASGTRRLLRFDTWTPNIGAADLFLGDPSEMSSYFEHSECHDHYHFDGYAEYELLTADDACVVATGHKQAFCLMDYAQYPGTDRSGAIYDCTYQGIQRGWQDGYKSHLDCQWVDVTDVPPGEYQLRIRINPEHLLNEANYENNEVLVPVTIGEGSGQAVDAAASCPPDAPDGLERACGFTRSYEGTCAPDTTMTVACSSACGVGSCVGDTIMRVCESAAGVNCSHDTEIASNDDSGCGDGSCVTGGDCCSLTQFSCPPTGTYTVWTAPYEVAGAASCAVVAM